MVFSRLPPSVAERSDRRELRFSAESELRASNIKPVVSVWLQLLQDASQPDSIKISQRKSSPHHNVD